MAPLWKSATDADCHSGLDYSELGIMQSVFKCRAFLARRRGESGSGSAEMSTAAAVG